MQDFDSIKKIWQQDRVSMQVGKEKPKLSSTSTRNRKIMQRTQLMSALAQAPTGLFIAWMALGAGFDFKQWYTYAAMGILSLLCFFQAGVSFYTYKKIHSIDDSASPAQHLAQWEAYYALRIKQIEYWGPVFAILLSCLLGIYYIEILGPMETYLKVLVVAWTAAWILFSIFYLGRKNIRKEKARLQQIMDELKEVEQQFGEEELEPAADQ